MPTLTYQKAVNATYLLAAVGVLTMPEVAYQLLLELSHLMLEFAHYLFEIFESALDHLVEHIFHTEARETQIIVFYIILATGLGATFYLCRSIGRFFCRLMQNLQVTLLSYKGWCLGFWAESAANKFKLIAGFNGVLTFVYLINF